MENWYLIALLASFVVALYVYVNQFLKLDANVAMVYRGAFLAVVLLPFIFLFEPIANPYFYVYCFVQGFLLYAIDSRVFKLSRDKGAELTSLYQPLSIVAIFLVWIMLKPAKISEMLGDKLVFGLEILCLILISYATIKIKNAKASKGSLPLILPLIILAIIIDTMNKLTMDMGGENLASTVYYYNLVTAIVVGVCSVFNYRKEKIEFNFFAKKSLAAGFTIMVVLFALIVVKNVAMFYTPNPAYVSAIMGVTPLWIVGINFVLLRMGAIQTPKTIDLKWTVLLVVGVSLMILLANGAIL